MDIKILALMGCLPYPMARGQARGRLEQKSPPRGQNFALNWAQGEVVLITHCNFSLSDCQFSLILMEGEGERYRTNGPLFSVTMNSNFIKLTGNKDRHKISDKFELQPDMINHFGVTCP